MNQTLQLILASSSPYRRAMLEAIGIHPQTESPDIDETPFEGESPVQLAERLARQKLQAVVQRLAGQAGYEPESSIVLASDQVCHLGEQLYGKPGNAQVAAQHLSQFSNNWVSFSTSIALQLPGNRVISDVEQFAVHFRPLMADEIDEYLALDAPFDCAGSIKVESRGFTLLDDTRGRDINTLYGLPMMRMAEILRESNHSIFILK